MPKRSIQDASDTPQKGEESKTKRSWSASQLHRKRQLDRESQRIARAKTKGRIEHLEALVKTLQENDDDRIRKLLRKIDEQQAEIQKLRDVIRGINRLIDTSKILAISAEENNNERDDSSKDDYDSCSPPIPAEMLETASDAVMGYSNVADNDTNLIQSQVYQPVMSPDPSVSTDMTVSAQPSSVQQLAAFIADDYQLDGRLWYLAGGVLSHILKHKNQTEPIITAFDEDIAIRAVMEGWPAVLERHELDYGWQWLKELDERIYSFCPAHVRLMHMRNTRLVFVHQMNPGSGVQKHIPPFFQARPSQAFVNHDPLVEHFPWPGFRERLLFSPLKFATNKFMDALRMNVEFTWNGNECDLYVRDCATGLYSYAEEVTRRMMDIRCYAAKREFFDIFPELRADIPCCAVTLNSLFPKSRLSILDKEDTGFGGR